MSQQPKTLIEAIRNSGLSIREIARLAEVDNGNLSRWLRGESGITLDRAERIANAIGLQFRLTKISNSVSDVERK